MRGENPDVHQRQQFLDYPGIMGPGCGDSVLKISAYKPMTHKCVVGIQSVNAYRAVLSEFGVVRLLRTSSNHCDAGGSRPTGQFRVRSVWFDHTKPPRTTWWRGKQAYRAGTSQLRAVTPHRTSSNHCDAGGSMPIGQVRVSSGRFNHTKPPRTTVMQGEACL